MKKTAKTTKKASEPKFKLDLDEKAGSKMIKVFRISSERADELIKLMQSTKPCDTKAAALDIIIKGCENINEVCYCSYVYGGKQEGSNPRCEIAGLLAHHLAEHIKGK